MEQSVFVIEHDDRLRDAICLHFGLGGYGCEAFADAAAAMRALPGREVDLVVMDFGSRSGCDMNVCEGMRRLVPPRTPILLLSRECDNADVLTALERCVDDFVTKPINFCELIARGRALMRRAGGLGSAPRSSPPLVQGELIVDSARRRVEMAGEVVTMTDQEFRLLYTLASRPGVVFRREDLLAIIWGSGTFVTTRSVDALVKRVRRKLETAAPASSPLITIRSVGYKLCDGLTSHAASRSRTMESQPGAKKIAWAPTGPDRRRTGYVAHS